MDKIKILIAEDIDIIRENFCDIINHEDEFKLVGCSDSGEGIVVLAMNTAFDILLMDIEMETPFAGIEAAKAIMKSKKDAKIIFSTIHEDEDTVLKAMGTGAVDYIVKSDDAKKIVSHIKKAFKDKTELEHAIANCMKKEFVRLRKTEESLLYFIKNVAVLTTAEKQIIRLLLEDKKVTEIADMRMVEVVTIKSQVGQLLKKFKARRTKEITKMIVDMNLQSLFDE